MISSLPSSYSSGKVSPLTPNDSIHHPAPFQKDYSPSSFPDYPERRSYQSDLSDDFAMSGITPSPFSSQLPVRFNNHPNHGFRPENAYDDIPHYMGNPHTDMTLRMPVDEQLARHALRHHPIMGTSNDLQTFIRWVSSFFLFFTHDLPVLYSNNTSARPIGLHSASVLLL